MTTDPYKYFRIEAREILETLGQGILRLEREGVEPQVVDKLLRSAHTLKGAARIVKLPKVAELSHLLEDLLAPLRNVTGQLSTVLVNELFKLTDEMGREVKLAVDQISAHSDADRPPTLIDSEYENVVVPVAALDLLMRELAEAAIQLAALRDQAEKGSFTQRDSVHGAKRSWENHYGKAERGIKSARERVGELRLLPVHSLFPGLERGIRDGAKALGKTVDFTTNGGEHRLDAHVMKGLNEALLHIVTNAVTHGIESERERRRLGKPPRGLVELRIQRRGRKVAITCRDDGCGLDVAEVRKAVVERGLVSAERSAELNLADMSDLVFRSGVSTKKSVSLLSGRGVGLDAVRQVVRALKGDVTLESRPGFGTTVEICLPISVESLTVLQAEVGGVSVGFPFDAVKCVFGFADQDLISAEGRLCVIWENEAVSYQPLGTYFGRAAITPRRKREKTSIVILQSGSKLAAVGVERILGTSHVVTRPLPELASSDLFDGASFDRDGDPQLIISPVGLVNAVCSSQAASTLLPEESNSTLLVIDDSVTTRMLEQSVLETAGYKVDLAASAEEGLEMARARDYAMFVVDVEMPGMNGFQFLEASHQDPLIHAAPAILVTSLGSEESKRRGERAGAKAYIVKSEFNEQHFLTTIRNILDEI